MPGAVDSKKGKYARPDGSRIWEYLAIFACSIFSFSIGTTIGWVSPTIVKLLDPESTIPFTPDDVSTMVAAMSVGHLVAPPMGNALVDRIGRRRTLLLSGLPVLVSSAMIMTATHVWVIHIARILAGVSVGMCISFSPMYLGEIASTRTRGLASSSIGVMINLGVLFSYGVCPYLSIFTAAGALMTISLIFEIVFWFVPETPYYLASVGDFEAAEAVLAKLRGKTDVSDELDAIKDTVPMSEDASGKTARVKGTLKDLFVGRANRRALAIGLVYLIPQHWGGYLMILMYGELIFKDAGSVVPSYLASMIVGVVQLVASVLVGFLVDNVGRRPVILGAGIAAGLANGVMGSYLFFKEYTDFNVSEYYILFLVAVLVQVFAFNCGLLSTHMVIMSEVFATEIKSIAMCLVGICSAALAILTSKLYISIAVTWGTGHALPFLCSSLIVSSTTILLFRMIPETKGKTFSQIQRELGR